MLNGHDRHEALHRLKQNVRDQIEHHRQEKEHYALGAFLTTLLLIIILCFVPISFLLLALR